ncbi:MAG: hypothetical protein IKE31_12185, partial [Eubacterium sp.]|nr:hypothetical protein [Eubacterium sp.]
MELRFRPKRSAGFPAWKFPAADEIAILIKTVCRIPNLEVSGSRWNCDFDRNGLPVFQLGSFRRRMKIEHWMRSSAYCSIFNIRKESTSISLSPIIYHESPELSALS